MTNKKIFLGILILLLVGFSLYLNRDWFASEKIQISHRSGPPLRFANRMQQKNKAVIPLFFEFNRKLKVSSVKVIPVSELATNKFHHPVWELIPVSQPVATKGFEYGIDIPGMKAPVPGAVADPLEPGVPYRLFVQAGSLKLEYDFTPEPPAH